MQADPAASGRDGAPDPLEPKQRDVVVIRSDAEIEAPLKAPTYHDQVRFWIAVSMLAGVGVLASALVASVALGGMTAADAKERALSIVALFGIVAPIIGFYFAAKERG
jgi:hypothetical protein